MNTLAIGTGLHLLTPLTVEHDVPEFNLKSRAGRQPLRSLASEDALPIVVSGFGLESGRDETDLELPVAAERRGRSVAVVDKHYLNRCGAIAKDGWIEDNLLYANI
jgi:hypothetical protein